MRDRLEKSALQRMPAWQKTDERLQRLVLMDWYLDGTIYDHLPYEYDEESKPSESLPRQIQAHNRKPSIRLGAAKTASRNVARKLFAGRHAPSLVIENNPDAVVSIQKYLNQAGIQKEMIGLVTRGSIGSVAATFKVIEIDGQVLLVMHTHKATECFPEFDAAKQLRQLTIAYEVDARWFMAYGIETDYKGDQLVKGQKYFYIRRLDKQREIFFQPVSAVEWNPVEGPEEKLKEIADGELQPFAHNLGFVPAQWFVNMSGGEFPDGDCLFKEAIPNIVAYDYNVSQMDLGLKNAACPVTVIKGSPVQYNDESGKPMQRPQTRYLHFEATIKDPEGITEEGGDAKLLESSGQGFLANLKELELLKKIIDEQISKSRKDPDKVTTAMSGKGMEIIEEEFMDLVFELRTCYGEDGYLKMVRKMCLAGKKARHPRLKNVSEEDIDNLELGWPDLHDMSPQEYQQYTTGIIQAQEAGIVDEQQAADLHRAKVDVPISNARKKSGVKKPVVKTKTKSVTRRKTDG